MAVTLESFFEEDFLLEFRGAKTWNDQNQITKLPKMGWFYPVSLQYDQNNESGSEIYSLEHRGPIKDPLLHGNQLRKLKRTFELVSSLISKLGIRSQTQKFVIVDFNDNKNIVHAELKSDPSKDIDVDGYADTRTGTVYINKELFFNSIDRFVEVLIHEFAHTLWKTQFSKNEKKAFIRWYQENVAKPTFEKFYSSDDVDDYDIWEKFQDYNDENMRRRAFFVLPKLIEKHPRSNEKDMARVKSRIQNRIRKDKNFLNSEESVRSFLDELDFSEKKKLSIPSKLNKDEFEALRELAVEEGLTPSEYAATDPDELWAETVMYAAHHLGNISRELKSVLVNMLSGTSQNI